MGVDPSFLRRVHWTGLILSVGTGAFLAAYHDPAWGAGFLLSALWSVANLWSLEQLMRAALRPAGRRPRPILMAGAIKLPVLYALLLLLLARGGLPALSIAAGLSVPLVVIVLKVAGQAVAPRIARPDRRSRISPAVPHSSADPS